MAKQPKVQDTVVVAVAGTTSEPPAKAVKKVINDVKKDLAPPKASAPAKRPHKVEHKPASRAHTAKTKPEAPKRQSKPKEVTASLVKEVDQQAQQQMQKLQQEETQEVFDIANQWGHRDDLSPLERCHGAAHEVYVRDHSTNNGQATQFHENYVKQFDTTFVDQIRARQIRAAEELFQNTFIQPQYRRPV